MKMASIKRILPHLVKGIMVGGIAYMGLEAYEQFFFPRSEFYQIALHLVTKHPEAIKYLGEPITDEYIDINLSKNRNSDKTCYFSVPLKGPKATGTMRYLVSLSSFENMDYHISDIELFINNQEKTKITILESPIPMHNQ